jgi:hypothetical protein
MAELQWRHASAPGAKRRRAGAGGQFQHRLRTGLTPENRFLAGNEEHYRDKPSYRGKPGGNRFYLLALFCLARRRA